MLQSGSALAIIPKARAIFSRRLSRSDYAELMRRRTVPEVALFLKNHPYFHNSLKLMPTKDLHRGQLEAMLGHDIFVKYESLMRYDYDATSFSGFFALEAETTQIINALRAMSYKQEDEFIQQMPSYIQSHLEVDLMKLARANNFKQLYEGLSGTTYHAALAPIYKNDIELKDLQGLEKALLTNYYKNVLILANKNFKGTELRDVKEMFLSEAELYNMDIIFRIKLYFNDQFTSEQLQKMLLPIYYKISKRHLFELAQAKSPAQLTSLLRDFNADNYYTVPNPDFPAAREKLPLYKKAITLLHFTSSPCAALAAFMSFAKLERSNIINCLEGVRYEMLPEEIDKLLLYR